MITSKQIRLIWVLARQTGIDTDLLHDMVLRHTGKSSIKTLSKTEVQTVIKALIQAGGKQPLKRRPRKNGLLNVVELISKEQRWLIKQLEQNLSWTENPERLKGFIARVIKKGQISTKQEAIKVIQGLKHMVERETNGRANNGYT
jgi:phage gp16-like protein